MWRKIALTLFTKGYGAVGNLILVLLTANFLGAEARGQIALVVLAVSIVGMAQSIVGGASLIYFANKREQGSLLNTSMLWSTLMSAAIGLFIPFIGLAPMEFTGYLIGIAAFQGIITAQHSFLVGKEQILKYAILDGIRTTTLIVYVCVRFFVFGIMKIEEVLISYLLANILSVIAGMLLIRKGSGEQYPRKKAALSELIRYGTQIQLNNLSQLFNYRFVYYFVEKLQGLEALGIFSVAVSIAESIWIICRSIATIQLSRIVNEVNTSFQRKITLRLSGISFIATGLLTLIVLFLPVRFYTYLFGPEFAAIPVIIAWFSPAILFLSFYTIFNHYFSGKNMNWVNIKGSVVGNIILVSSTYYLVANFALNGAALAYGFAFLGMTVYLLYQFYAVGQSKPLEVKTDE
jgi:O-antigen/teichoic acid export membrane protein